MTTTVGGIVLDPDGVAGSLVTQAGQLQYDDMLLGVGTSAGWFELVGWRDTPDTSVSDTTKPQAHGAYPGDIWAEAQTVTFTYRLEGGPAERLAALRAIESRFPLDGVERPLVVEDGGGATLRMARVLQRRVPQDWNLSYVLKLQCSVQFLCADPRRYSLAQVSATVAAPASSGGLAYPLAYPLTYGTSTGGSRTVTNDGTTASPLVAVFAGPLTDPVLVSNRGWRVGFKLTLTAGETLVVDAAGGTALLNGEVDRLYTIDTASSPLERCVLPPGSTVLSLAAAAGSGQVALTYRHAYL